MPRQRRNPPQIRGPRTHKYVLVFWLDCAKPCRDVVHENTVKDSPDYPNLEVDQERIFLVGKAKTERRGRILKRGKLRLLPVNTYHRILKGYVAIEVVFFEFPLQVFVAAWASMIGSETTLLEKKTKVESCFVNYFRNRIVGHYCTLLSML